MFAAFWLLARASYIEVTSDTFADTLSGGPVFVNFYDNTTAQGRAISSDFQDAGYSFRDFTFAGVECNQQPSICADYRISAFPTLVLLPERVAFVGNRDFDGFCDFVENRTKSKAVRLTKAVVELTNATLGTFVHKTQCAVITFFARGCGHCRRFLPEFKFAAWVFLFDIPRVAFGSLCCSDSGTFCDTEAIDDLPAVRVYDKGERSDFKGGRNAADLVDFVNARCGTERGLDGLLNDTAGLIDEASRIAEKFLLEEDKAPLIARLRQIPGAEMYVAAATSSMVMGQVKFARARADLRAQLKKRALVPAKLDEMKRQYNVFGEFIRHEPDKGDSL
jgi:thiol-disulfide isomerase/thioredoxin